MKMKTISVLFQTFKQLSPHGGYWAPVGLTANLDAQYPLSASFIDGLREKLYLRCRSSSDESAFALPKH